MNLSYISKAVKTRLEADTGTGGLYSGTAGALNTTILAEVKYSYASPGAATFPYMVWTLDWADDLSSFTGAGARFMLAFNIKDQATRGYDRISAIVDRLVGDAMLSTGNRNVPTYGFDRHVLVLASNTLEMVTHQLRWIPVGGQGPVDENYLESVVTFEGVASTKAVNE